MKTVKTEWQGLWESRENCYCSKVFAKGDIPAYARLIVLKNSFYKNGTRRPRFVFMFATGDAARAIAIPEEDYNPNPGSYDKETDTYYDEDGGRLYTRSEVQRCIDGAVEDARRGYYDLLVEDYV